MFKALAVIFCATGCVTPQSNPSKIKSQNSSVVQVTDSPSIAVYFSPDGGCEGHVVGLINSAKTTLDVAIYAINNEEIVRALQGAKARGVKMRILIDRVQAAGAGNRETTLRLRHEGFDVRIHSKNKIQHNKFAITDGRRVETGSFNWTTPAEHSNEENCIFIDDPTLAKVYENRFNEYLWVVNTKENSEKAFQRLENKRSDPE